MTSRLRHPRAGLASATVRRAAPAGPSGFGATFHLRRAGSSGQMRATTGSGWSHNDKKRLDEE